MSENRFHNKLEEQEAAELIDQNVSFDFKKFLEKVGPAPSFSEPVGPTADCLSVDTVWAFHRNDLNPSARTRVEGHVAECEVCQELLTSYADAQPARMPDGLFDRVSHRLEWSSAARARAKEGRLSWLRIPELLRWVVVPAMAVLLAWVIYPVRPYFGQKSQSAEMASSSDSLATKQEVEDLRKRVEQDEQANADLQGDLKVVTDKLEITQGQLKKARVEAAKANADTTQKVTALNTSVQSELATKAANDDLKTVDTKVVGVRTDLDATREDLKMARSELGTLIARNHDEIDQLRRLGERDYVEFTLTRKNQPQKVGNIVVELKSVDQKHNRVSISLTVEDKTFDKKVVLVNQPMFFYVVGTRQPEELVVNRVGGDSVSGYVSIPKANGPSNRN